MNGMQNKHFSGSEKVQSIGVRASNNKNPESEDEDSPLKSFKNERLETSSQIIVPKRTELRRRNNSFRRGLSHGGM